jgi:hypothetical protein
MTTSHLIGLATFGTLALFGILSWVLSRRHPAITADPVMVRRARRMGLLLPALGVVAGYGAFALDNRMAVVTLYEVMAEGSVGLAPGTRAPLRTLLFNVEHPGVEHELLVAPVSETFQNPTSPVDVSFSLHGPAGEALLARRTERFAVESRSRRRPEWEGKTFGFTPLAAGPHTLRVIPLTEGIAGIHVRVADPLKRDGKRMPGY